MASLPEGYDITFRILQLDISRSRERLNTIQLVGEDSDSF